MRREKAKWKVAGMWLAVVSAGILVYAAAGLADPRLPIALLLLALLPVAWFSAASSVQFLLQKLPKAKKAVPIAGDIILIVGILGLFAPQSRAFSLLLLACGLRLSLSRFAKLGIQVP